MALMATDGNERGDLVKVSRLRIAQALDEADSEFRWCWDKLTAFKNGELDNEAGQDVLRFQPRLFHGILILDQSYRDIKAEEKRLIKAKHKFKPAWFSRRMSALKSYRQVLRHAIGVGKTLGDGFAWIFYKNDPDLINDHLKRPRQFLLPPRIGRIGEQAFIEGLQGIGGNMVLHHGITSFLRLGDVSFIDLRTMRISGIGEIKTTHIKENQFQITLGYVGERAEALTSGITASNTAESHQLIGHAEQRLNRQMGEISAAIRAARNQRNEEILKEMGKFHFQELEHVVRNSNRRKLSHRLAGPSTILCALRIGNNRRLSANLFYNPPDIGKKIENIILIIHQILNNNFQDNTLIVGSIGGISDYFPIFIRGTIPIFWWPVSSDCLYDIIFENVTVISLYNPAYFWDDLRKKGFEVDVGDRVKLKRLRRTKHSTRVELGDLNHFNQLIEHFLMSYQTVSDLIETAIATGIERAEGKNCHINIATRVTD